MKLRLFLTCLVLASACEKKPEPPTAQTNSASVQAVTHGETVAQTTNTSEWPEVDIAALTDDQKAQFQLALGAQKELGGTLVQALTAAVAEKGFAASIEFCRGEAPTVTASVGEKHGVEIGRTSHKLRNPDNAAPSWGAAAVVKAEDDQMVFEGPNRALGVLSPIKLAPLCVNCHGAPDKLAEGVPDALTQQYPADAATGFAEGDVRGFFWVQVPAGT